MRVEVVRKPCVELALDYIGKEFREQGRVTDCIESLRYVWRDSPNPMSDIEGIHPLLGEEKQHISGLDPGIFLGGRVHLRLRCSHIVKQTTKPYSSQCNSRGKTC